MNKKTCGAASENFAERFSLGVPQAAQVADSTDRKRRHHATALCTPSSSARVLTLWFPCQPDQDLMITVQTNAQPPEGTDKIGDVMYALYDIVKRPKAD
jgi:hypothetical protein